MTADPVGPGRDRDWREETLGIVFFDLARFARWVEGRTHLEVAAFLQSFYEQAAEVLEPAGVRIVKFMGDAGLGVFEPGRAADVVAALDALRARVRRAGDAESFDTDLTSKVHVGSVVTGTFGAPGAARFDVMGPAVCEAARLPGHGLVISEAAEAFVAGG